MTAIAYAENTRPSSRAADASMQLGGGTGLYTTGLIRTGRDPHCGHGTGLFTTGLQSELQADPMATRGISGLFTAG
tara:strand:+ start:223 stop:450 length:228 start_codon:yes stop_codon:yes gene_type:complete